jgi:oxygen-dependent protoporphyrinogen oxidase
MIDRIVVGGGFSGLLAARSARRAGETVTVLEAGPQWGGMVSRVSLAEYEVDAGAEAFSVVGDSMEELVAELGLGDKVVYPEDRSPNIITAEGSFVIPHGVMGIPGSLESLRGIPEMTDEVIERARSLDNAPLPDGWESLSVADLVTARLGPEVLGTVVEPLCLGVHSCVARDIEARAIFPEVLRALGETGSLINAVAAVRGSRPRPGSAVATLSGGLFQLVDALVRDLLDTDVVMRSDTRVMSLSEAPDGWQVDTTAGSLRARRVSLCVGPASATELLPTHTRILSELKQISTVDQAISVVLVRAPQLNDFPLGSGALVAESVHTEAKAVTHLNAKWGWWHDRLPADHHALRFSFGRGGILPPGAHDHLVDQALRVLCGIENPQKIASRDVVWRAGSIRPSLGHSARVERLTHAAQEKGLTLHGSYMSGNGLLGISRTFQGEAHVATH